MSGHSKGHNIQAKKGKTDAARGKIFTKIGREIAIAVREGGSNPDSNSKLKDIIAKAKANNMPNDNIQRSIKKAAGEGTGATYEEITYEGYAPGGVAIIAQIVTDNRNRTSSDVRHIFDKNGGSLGTPGSVSYMFDNKGVISLTIKEVINDGGVMRITFSNKTGERCCYDPYPVLADGPFGEDDNWMFAAPLGKCDDPDIPSGADEQLQEQLYVKLIEPYTDAGPGYRNIYVDRRRIVFDGTNFPNIFYTTDPEAMCIDHEDMNAYYNLEKHLIRNTVPSYYHLEGYSLISIEIEGMALTEPAALTHHNEIEYGIRLRVSVDEFGMTKSLLSE